MQDRIYLTDMLRAAQAQPTSSNNTVKALKISPGQLNDSTLCELRFYSEMHSDLLMNIGEDINQNNFKFLHTKLGMPVPYPKGWIFDVDTVAGIDQAHSVPYDLQMLCTLAKFAGYQLVMIDSEADEVQWLPAAEKGES